MSNVKEEEKVGQEAVESGVESGIKPPEAEKEVKTLDEEVKNEAPQVDEGIKIVVDKGNEREDMLKVIGAKPENIEEFKKEEGKIEQGVEAAKGKYKEEINAIRNNPEAEFVRKCPKCGDETQQGKFCTKCGAKLANEEKVGQVENNKELGEKKTKEEILKEVEKINKKIDNAPKSGLGLKEIDELKKQREQLFDLLDEYSGDYGTQIGKKDNFKKPKSDVNQEVLKEKGDIVDTEILSEKTMQEIHRLPNDSTSELSILKKSFAERENRLTENKNKLEKVITGKNNFKREENIKFYKNLIKDDEAVLEKQQKKIQEIMYKLEKN